MCTIHTSLITLPTSIIQINLCKHPVEEPQENFDVYMLLFQANIYRNERNIIDLYVMLLRFSR